MCTPVFNAAYSHSQDVKPTQVSIDAWMKMLSHIWWLPGVEVWGMGGGV